MRWKGLRYHLLTQPSHHSIMTSPPFTYISILNLDTQQMRREWFTTSLTYYNVPTTLVPCPQIMQSQSQCSNLRTIIVYNTTSPPLTCNFIRQVKMRHLRRSGPRHHSRPQPLTIPLHLTYTSFATSSTTFQPPRCRSQPP